MHATQPQGGHCPEPTTRSVLGLPETDAGRRLLALRESGYTGWVDQDGIARSEAEFTAWSAFMSRIQSGYLPGTGGGYVLTEAGRQALAKADTAAQYELADAFAQGVTPDQFMTDDWDGNPCFEWLSDQDADDADGYGERLRDTYLTQHETADAREPQAAASSAVNMTEPPARVLLDAATYLERYGWITGAYYDGTSGSFTPPACMVGAIGMVCYGGPVDAPAQHFDDPGFLDFEEAVLHLDRWLLVEDGTESYEFNDARGRTLADVTHVLRRAAAVPAEELIDALKVADAAHARMVDLFGGDLA